MNKKLNKEQIIKLINLYRSHDLLWDMKSKLYRRNDLKIKAYENIALEMEMSVDIVKKKIRSLRCTYTGEKQKMLKKSGSAAEDVFESSLFWFHDMKFLDSSIATRKSTNNSNDLSVNAENFEDYFEESSSYEWDESFTNKKTVKRAKQEETSKFDEALQKLINTHDKENEFTAFATSLSFQLQKFPEDEAYELMGEFQNILTQRKLKNMRERRLHPMPLECNNHSYNQFNYSPQYRNSTKPSVDDSIKRSSTPIIFTTIERYTPQPSDILSCAISNAEIDLCSD